MFDIFDTKNFDKKRFEQKFSKEQVTEELDNIPSDRYIHTVNPMLAKQMLSQAQYDYKPTEYTDGGDDCTSDLIDMDITERNEMLKNSLNEAEYHTSKLEKQKEAEEEKEFKKKVRAKAKKIVEE